MPTVGGARDKARPGVAELSEPPAHGFRDLDVEGPASVLVLPAAEGPPSGVFEHRQGSDVDVIPYILIIEIIKVFLLPLEQILIDGDI